MALGTLTPSVARWTPTEVMDETEPNPASAALVAIDVQRDVAVAGGPAEVPGSVEAIPAMRQVVDRFRRHRRPIIHGVRLYRPDGSNVDRSRRVLVTEGHQLVAPATQGAESVEELKPAPTVVPGVRVAPQRLPATGRRDRMDHVQAPLRYVRSDPAG